MNDNFTTEQLCRNYGNLVGRLIRVLCEKITFLQNKLSLSDSCFDDDWKYEIKSLCQSMIKIEHSKNSPQLEGFHTYCSDPVNTLLSIIEPRTKVI